MKDANKVLPWVITAVVALLVLAVAVVAIWPQESWDYLRALTPAWATIIGGSIVGTGALLAFKASMETRNTMEKTANMTHGREVMSARQDRYTKIAEQLSSEHETVRLAGVYALAALADEWQAAGESGQRDVAVKLLCAYLRAKPRRSKDASGVAIKKRYALIHWRAFPRGRPGTSKNPDDAATEDREVRNAVVSIIQSHVKAGAECRWPASLINLSGANLTRANLTHADLSGASLSGANLTRASLHWADLSGANLTGANLTRAVLMWTNLSKAHLDYAVLKDANLSEAVLTKAQLSSANLSEALLTGANLSHANLYGADLSGTDLSDTDLSKAFLVGANLSNTRGVPKKDDSSQSADPGTSD